METNFLKLYIDSNKLLVKTLTIKSEVSISSINDYIRLRYGDSTVDPYDPYSWKYYLNISGQYHDLDTMMSVKSLDTLEQIDFTISNLVIHTETAKAYQYGSRYYYSLLTQYPLQEQLILGILYPSDITTAVESPDGTILSYPLHLVEPQEITLISELQDFILHHQIRWDVTAYGLPEHLYNAAQLAVLYLNMIPKLLNLRLKRCHTNEVHSFHVREYLASHGSLDRYMPYMTSRQALWLYRNIRYIELHSGTTSQFHILVQHLLSDRRIPLNEFSIRQLSEFTDEYQPEINVRRKPLNPQFNVPERDFFELDLLYAKESTLAYGNIRYMENHTGHTTTQFRNSAASVMQTKDLESSMIDYSDAVPDTLTDVLMRQWAYMAGHGLYPTIINFRNPITLQTHSLSALDAFSYMYYLSLNSIGIQIEHMPMYINIKHRRHILPSVDSMLQLVDHGFRGLPAIAASIRANQPVINTVHSTTGFFNLSYKIYEQSLVHWQLVSSIDDHYERACVQNLVNQLYGDEAMLTPNYGVNVSDWLFSLNLPDYTSDSTGLIQEIFTRATGLTIDSNKLLKNIQRAMISILSQLSSYSVQFITEINQSKIIPLNWAAIRTGHYRYHIDSYHYTEINIRVLDAGGIVTDTISLPVQPTDQLVTQSIGADISADISLLLVEHISDARHIDAYYPTIDIAVTYDVYDDSIVSDMVGWEYYLALTPAQQQQIKSIY